MKIANRFHSLKGGRLNKNIYSRHGALLLPADTILYEDQLLLLQHHRISITVDDIEIPCDPSSGFHTAVEEVKRIFQVARHADTIPIPEIQEQLLPQIARLAERSSLVQILRELQQKDEYTYQHNIAVGVMSTMIGMWLGFGKQELLQLSLAATLHDIGKAKIPDTILNKAGKLTDAEYAEMKRHTCYGYFILKNSNCNSERIAKVALEHHEREDGNGYPYGLCGDRIDPMSKIVAVADVFHAMTSKRVYKEASPFYEVLMKMREHTFGQLDPYVMTTFNRHLMNSLIGNEVELSNGMSADIVLIHPNDPLRPTVRCGVSSFIDLRQHRELHIENVM